MKSVRLKFEKIKKANPLWSSFICFAEAIRGSRRKGYTIRKNFDKLVEKDDYRQGEKEEILLFLIELSKLKNLTYTASKSEGCYPDTAFGK